MSELLSEIKTMIIEGNFKDMAVKTTTALIEAGIRKSVKIMIGGAPVTQDFANQIGADGYTSNAASASDLARELTACL